jgi:double-stranded uracil-DNA glycosylase
MTHRAIEDWMGVSVETLKDVMPHSPRAICVGLNPAPTSVAAGHYYQGRSGQRFLDRLQGTGLLPTEIMEWADDELFRRDIGLTDLVKRPTRAAVDVRSEELVHGRALLLEKLRARQPALVIFTFKAAAEAMFGKFPGNGFQPELQLGTTGVFVMPGPYEARKKADATLAKLRDFDEERWSDLPL